MFEKLQISGMALSDWSLSALWVVLSCIDHVDSAFQNDQIRIQIIFYLRKSSEYEYYSAFQKWPITNTNSIPFKKSCKYEFYSECQILLNTNTNTASTSNNLVAKIRSLKHQAASINTNLYQSASLCINKHQSAYNSQWASENWTDSTHIHCNPAQAWTFSKI